MNLTRWGALPVFALMASMLAACGRSDAPPAATTAPAAVVQTQPVELPHAAVLRLGTTDLRMGGRILALAASPDGSLLAAGDQTGHVGLFDTTQGTRVRLLEGQPTMITGLAFTSDGRRVLASTFGDLVIEGWDAATGMRRLMAGASRRGGEGLSIALAPDGKRLATWDGRLAVLWSIDDKDTITRAWDKDSALPPWFSHNGATMLCAREQQVQWCDVMTGKPTDSFDCELPSGAPGESMGYLGGMGAHVGVALLAPSGKTLAIGDQRNGNVRVVDASGGTVRAAFQVGIQGTAPLAFTSDGGTLAVAAGNHVELWDLGESKLLRRLATGEHDKIEAVAVIGHDKMVAAAAGNVIRCWDLASGAPALEAPAHTQAVTDVVFAPNGMTIATASSDGTARTWDAGTGKPIRQILLATDPRPRLAFTSGGLMATWSGGEDRRGAYRWNPFIIMGDPDDDDLGMPRPTRGPKAVVRLYNVEVGAVVHAIPGASMVLPGVGDTLWAITGVHTDTIGVWDTAKNKRLYSMRAPLPELTALAASEDGRVLALAFGEKPDENRYMERGDEHPKPGVIRVFEAASGEDDCAITLKEGPTPLLALAPDGKALAAAGGDGKLHVWNLPAGRERYGPQKGMPQTLLFSPDSGALVVQVVWMPDPNAPTAPSEWGQVKTLVLDAATGAMRCKLALTAGTAAGDTQAAAMATLSAQDPRATGIAQLVFAPNGSMLAGTLGGTDLGLWDARQGTLLARLKGHSGPINAVRFSADGARVATASDDTTVLVWDVTAATGRSPFAAP